MPIPVSSSKRSAVEGGPLQIPSPLIRVTEGTEIRAVVRNSQDADGLALHGLYSRPGKASADDVVLIPPGETREIQVSRGKSGHVLLLGRNRGRYALGPTLGAVTRNSLAGSSWIRVTLTPEPDRVLLISLWDAEHNRRRRDTAPTGS